MADTNLPTNSAADMVNSSYKVLDITQNAGTNGYYSKYNTSTTQSFSGAVGQSVLGGASRALPSNFKTDVQTLSDFRLGTLLRRRGIISGDTASIVDGTIDFLRSDKQRAQSLVVPKFSHSTRFIPIVLKSEFKLQSNASGTGRDNYYLVFDSTPDKISFTKSAQWNQKDFYGRPEPIQVFATASAVTFSLTGMFFSDSEKNHETKLELENRLFAFVTPSKNHFMPSPIEVRIGEWKRLRCVVNSITVDYQGPWRTVSKPEITQEFNRLTQSDFTATGRSLASHSPYLFEVTFNFTIVSEFNNVQYAEDIIDNGYNGGYSNTNADDLSNILNTKESASGIKANKYQNSSFAISDNGTSIVYTLEGNAGQVGTIIDKASSFANTTGYLKSLGLPTDANGSTKTAALAQITSGLTATVQNSITKNYGAQITKLFGK